MHASFSPARNRWWPLRRALLIALALATAGATYQAGWRLGMSNTLSFRHNFYSLPYAVSHLYFGTSGYVGLRDVAELFVKAHPDVTNETLAQSLTLKPSFERLVIIPGDDKGDADFAILAFRVFGMRVESLYYLWFAMYFAGLVGFAAAYWHDESRLSAVVLLTCAVFVAFFALPLTFQLGSIHNPRAFGAVSLVGVLHLSFAMIDRQPLTMTRLLAAALQAALIAFSVDVRSTEWWQVLAVAGVGAWLWIRFRVGLASLWPCAVLVVALIGMTVYQRWAVDKVYEQSQLRGRVFWHNVGIGFALNPVLAQKYLLAVDDLPMIQLIRRHLLETNRKDEIDRLFRPAGQEDYIFLGITKDHARYERVAREVVLSIMWNNKYQTLRTFMVDKPRVLVRQLVWAAGYRSYSAADLYLSGQVSHLAPDSRRVRESIYLNPFRPWVFGAVMITGLLGGVSQRRREFAQMAGLSLWLFVISLLPTMAAYPIISAIAPVLVTIPLLMLAVTLWLVAIGRGRVSSWCERR